MASHQILADVVKVALHRSEDDGACGFGAAVGEQRAHDVEPGLHGLGRHEHLRDEQRALAELLADDVERGDHALVENRLDIGARVDLGLHQLGHPILVVFHHRLVDVLDCHLRPPGVWMSSVSSRIGR
jgi:hypothetical protein